MDGMEFLFRAYAIYRIVRITLFCIMIPLSGFGIWKLVELLTRH